MASKVSIGSVGRENAVHQEFELLVGIGIGQIGKGIQQRVIAPAMDGFFLDAEVW